MLILAVKAVLASLFSSDYQDSLFVPFVQGWLKDGENPYERFADTQLFPYPPLMLFIESVGGLLSLLCGGIVPLRNIAFKIPLFAFDFVCFFFLTKLFPNKRRQITAIYSCSPILLYSTYMHGQLDIIPTALLVSSLFFLMSPNRRNILLSSIFVSAALCCKFHILAILPIFFLFVVKRDGWKKAVVYEFLIPLCVTAAFVAPFWGGGFVHAVVFNKEQSVLTKIAFDFASLKVYVPILAVLLIYLRLLVISRMNDELFFGFSAILFSVFLILVPPMPGWYVWELPFLVIFYIDIRSNRHTNFLIFSLLNVMYCLYFIFAHRTSFTDLYLLGANMNFLKTENEVVRNAFFTALFAVHAYVIYYIYRIALRSNVLYRRQNAPFVVGISGDSGSGKSTLVGIFKTLFGEKQILTVECDGDHKWNRNDENWRVYSHLNPVANFLYRQAKDIALLKSGKSVLRTEYNHATGMFDAPHKVLPKPYILVTGLHSLYLPQLRQLENLRIYMDIDENLRRFWKIQRDVHKRGHTLGEVVAQIEERMDDFHKYIEPQKKQADVLISYFDRSLTDCTASDYELNLSLKITARTGVNFEPLVMELSKYGIPVHYEFNDEMRSQTLVCDGVNLEQSTIPVMQAMKNVVPRLEYFLKEPVRTKNDMWSVIGIVMLVLIDDAMNENVKI